MYALSSAYIIADAYIYARAYICVYTRYFMYPLGLKQVPVLWVC